MKRALSDRYLSAWKGRWSYTGHLIKIRAEFEGYSRLDGMSGAFLKILQVLRYSTRSAIDRARNSRKLKAARTRPRSSTAGGQPLVSVVIPTLNRSGLLTERAIPSVLRQTYGNIEIIVVGDHCTDDTAERIEELHSDRITFLNLPRRSRRPKKAYDAWLIAGVEPSNIGLALSRGDWVVHLDDDDELYPELIEVLLRHALDNDLEFVYGKLRCPIGPYDWTEIGSFPPRLGGVPHSGVLYSSRLKFFSYDPNGWKYLEPGDWNLWRRMSEAGVRIGFVDRVLVTNYPAGPSAYRT